MAPAAVAGYALVHGVAREAVPSEIWRQIFCIIGGGFVGVSALVRLAGVSPDAWHESTRKRQCQCPIVAECQTVKSTPLT
jgi:hypothetical protein